jgi:signal peptide peptidase SppA
VVIPALRLSGVIGSIPLRGTGLTLAAYDRQIEALFAPAKAPLAILIVNSPGGSPVQSSLIAQRVRRLAHEKDRKVIAFVEDVAASGGYWLACAADEIYADPASLIGSIGVVSSSFGFQDAIARLGIERRLHATGERKALLDPFQPEREGDVEVLRQIQGDIMERFVAWVRERRGPRLQADGVELFDGRVWAGERARKLGLIDGLAEPRNFVRERFGPDASLRILEPKRGWLARKLRADLAPERLVAATLGQIEERAMWARYGL